MIACMRYLWILLLLAGCGDEPSTPGHHTGKITSVLYDPYNDSTDVAMDGLARPLRLVGKVDLQAGEVSTVRWRKYHGWLYYQPAEK